MKIELLYFNGCPSYQAAHEDLQAVLDEEEIKAEAEWVRIESPE